MSEVYNQIRNKRLKKIVDLNYRLSSMVEAKDKIRFPKIVISGDQSHGKTSIVENIIGYNLPRG